MKIYLVDDGLEAERVRLLLSNTATFHPASPTGLYDSVPFKSPYSLEYPTRNLIERVKTTPISPGSFKGSSPTKTVLKSVLPGDPGYFRSKFTRDAMVTLQLPVLLL